jgi:NTE family protein
MLARRYGVRFSFLQEYFDLLCSDLLSYPVANAVTASSAVPIVFNPVVVENYSDCSGVDISWLGDVQKRAESSRNIEMGALAIDLESYSDKIQRKYIHFVDGGITDNMGLRAMYDVVLGAGGPEAYLSKINTAHPEKMAVIAIDASNEPVLEMDVSNKEPSIAHSIGAMSGVQLHRYNTATLELVETSFYDWSDKLSTPEKTVKPYFIELTFENLQQPEARAFFNKVPTSFKLTDEQVDRLIAAGRQLLRDHPDFQRLLADLAKP